MNSSTKTLKARNGLKAKSRLSAKTSLTAKSTLKAKKTIAGSKKNTKSALVKKADAIFGHYIRLRDSVLVGDKWVGNCIDCDKEIVNRYYDGKKWRWTKSGNVGHFYSRGYRDLRYDELNCNLQSSYCNAWKDKETMQEGYRKGLALKYGEDTLEELRGLAVAKGYLGVDELKEIIDQYKVALDFYLKEEENITAS